MSRTPDPDAVLECSQLLQPLGLLERRGREPRVVLQERVAEHVDAQMAKRGDEARLTRVRYRRSREVERVAGLVQHHLDRVRITMLGLVEDGMGERAHLDRRVLRHHPDELIQRLDLEGRLVSLEVEDEVHPPVARRLGDAIGAARALGRRHDDRPAEPAHGGGDPLVVGGHDHALHGLELTRPLPDVLDQGFPADLDEGLAGKPHRGPARGITATARVMTAPVPEAQLADLGGAKEDVMGVERRQDKAPPAVEEARTQQRTSTRTSTPAGPADPRGCHPARRRPGPPRPGLSTGSAAWTASATFR